MTPKPTVLFHKAYFLPAGLFWEPVKGNSSVATRTFEKPLDAVVPVVVVVVLHTGLQRLEVGVITLSGGRKKAVSAHQHVRPRLRAEDS